MSTEPCERCGEQAPPALLRNVELRVDGDGVDDQTLCPDCFADWIARYQDEMAGDMPGANETQESVGSNITIAEEEPRPDTEVEALSRAVDAAKEQADSGTDGNRRGQGSDRASPSGGSAGDDIREVGDGPAAPGDGDVEIDLDGEEEDDEDGGGLF